MESDEAIRIRPARPGEAVLLSALAMESKAYWGYSPEFMEACREELSVSESDLRGSRLTCAVAERDGEVVGYYGLERLSGTEWELDALFIKPAHMGSGIGRGLLDHARRLAADAGVERIIIQGDPNADRFYVAAGAERCGHRESGSIPGRFLPLFEIRLS